MQSHPKQRRKARLARKARKISRKIQPKASKPHSQTRGKNRGTSPGQVGFDQAPQDFAGFLTLLLQRLSWSELEKLNQRKHRAGRPVYVLSRSQLLLAVVFHFTIRFTGDLAEHLFWLFGIQMSNGSLSERRQALPAAVFEELLPRVLRPIASSKESTQGLFKGLRLVGIDGVSYSLANTPKVNKRCRKGANQKGMAAFAKLQATALVELVMHNPLAACVGLEGESEWKLAKGLLKALPDQALLLADRLYGCAAFVYHAYEHLKSRGGHFLVRVKESSPKNLRVVQTYKDGSKWVEVRVSDPANYRRTMTTMQLREIRARVKRPGFRAFQVRLWTSLSCSQASAEELVRLYARRWEQELYFRELKHFMGSNDLLRSQTPETGAQEIAAMIIGSSLVAHERAKLEPGEQLQHRISFIKTWELLEPLWMTLLLGADILSEQQKQALCDRFYALMSGRTMPKKRNRSCPRVLRQPVQPWPRKKQQKSSQGPIQVTVIKTKSRSR